MPNISFTGHLAGLLVGLLLISQVGVDFLMPSKGEGHYTLVMRILYLILSYRVCMYVCMWAV